MSTTHPGPRPLPEGAAAPAVVCPDCRLRIGGHAHACPRCGAALTPAGRSVWREDRTLVVLRDAVLPDRCVRCGAPGDGRPLRHRLTWHHPALFLLVLIWVIPYIVVALAVRRTTTLTVSVCERHRRIRSRALWAGWGLLAAFLAAEVTAIALRSPLLGWLGVLALVAAPAVGMYGRRLVRATGIDHRLARTRGASEAFMDAVPDWSAPEGGALPAAGPAVPAAPPAATSASIGHILAETWPELWNDRARAAEFEWALEGLDAGVVAAVAASFAAERRPLPTPAVLRMAVQARGRTQPATSTAAPGPVVTWAPAIAPTRAGARRFAVIPGVLGMLGSLLTCVALGLTWAHVHGDFPEQVYDGSEVDGSRLVVVGVLISLVAGVTGIVVALRRATARAVGMCSAVCAGGFAFVLFGVLLAFGDLTQARDAAQHEFTPPGMAKPQVDAAAGFWMALVVGLLGAGAGVWGYAAMRRRQAEEG